MYEMVFRNAFAIICRWISFCSLLIVTEHHRQPASQPVSHLHSPSFLPSRSTPDPADAAAAAILFSCHAMPLKDDELCARIYVWNTRFSVSRYYKCG